MVKERSYNYNLNVILFTYSKGVGMEVKDICLCQNKIFLHTYN